MFLDLGQCFSSDEFLSHGFVFGGRVVLVRELIQGFVFAVVFMSFFDLVKLIVFFVATCLWINLVWRRIHNVAQSKICDPWSHTCVGQMATLGRLLSMPCSLLKALEKIDDTWWFRSIYTQVSSTIDQLWYDLYWSYLHDPFLHNFVRSSLCNDSTSCERMNMHEPSKYWGTPMT